MYYSAERMQIYVNMAKTHINLSSPTHSMYVIYYYAMIQQLSFYSMK